MNTEHASSGSADSVVGARVSAAIIDLILMAVLFVVMAVLFGDSSASSGEDESGVSINLDGLPFIAYVFLMLAYYYVMELKTGQTIGKKLSKVRVVSTDAEPLTPQRMALRTVLRLIDALPFFYLVGFITMLVSNQKQRIGDMAARTRVVRA